jgi:leucyl-tRNA synthetase
MTIVVQVNGKLRDRLTIPQEMPEEEIKRLALASDTVKAYLRGGPPKKIIWVPKKIVNVVV